MKIAVVGGGIAGLAAAWEVASRGHDAIVVEASGRLGGRIRTSDFLGLPVDEAADAFITRMPDALHLCEEIGVTDLVAPATGRAHLWVRGRLLPIPDGTVLGVPADLDRVAASGILSEEGLARAAAEPAVSSGAVTDDISIGALIRTRYGDEVAEYLVDPLLGGINAGGIDHLSLDVAAPQIATVARRHRSLLEGLSRMTGTAPATPTGLPVFQAPAGGMERLVLALADALRRAGAALMVSSRVTALERSAGGWTVGLTGPGATRCDPLTVDGIVLAAPAPVAASLLQPVAAEAATGLAGIDHASVVLATLGYERASLTSELEGSGFLVPKPEGKLITAASWFSNKWAHLDDGRHLIVRASAGRYGDQRALAMDDATLTAAVHRELADAMGLARPPVAVRTTRWIDAFPQLPAGHLRRVEALEAALARDAPALALAGSYLRGVGIPACIAGGRAAAARLVA